MIFFSDLPHQEDWQDQTLKHGDRNKELFAGSIVKYEVGTG